MTSILPTLSASPDAYKPRRPTADEILQEEGIKDWSDKVILITGASAGIGVETARAFAKVGAQLILPVRDLNKAKKVVDDIQSSAGGKANITLLTLDLASLQSVRECAAAFLKLNRPLNILICNAGIMAAPEGMKTKDGFDVQFGTNHLAHFLLFELLKDTLIKSSTKEFNSRVVTVSSAGHQISDIHWDDINFENTPYNDFQAYGQSKTANVLMAREIEKRYGNKGLHANSIHPGLIYTELPRHMDPAVFKDRMAQVPIDRIKTIPQGAATTVWAASAKEFEGKGGEYLEDCSHSWASDPILVRSPNGYFPHIYNEESAARLYDLSLKLVGLSDK